ncbi:MAG: amidohydrolase family protein [Pigmentiphaga sp.]|uniref:amidohydrolase family protein n=1 Tax=Pigmentiphaga sp. TaxID=1977564 RepID=UPI003B554D5C
MQQRTLIQGGRVLTMVPGDDAAVRDILVEGDRIVAIGPRIDVGDAQVIDASDCIVHPGFVDTHRHTWQTQLRTVATDWSLFDYVVEMRCIFSMFYQAEDAYLGNYVGALEALNAGITTVVDHCHIINSPDHAHEAARGLMDSGIRAHFCYGFWPNPTSLTPFTLTPGEPWRFEAAKALRKGLLSSDTGRVSFGIAPSELEGMPFDLSRSEIQFAREMAASRISLHVAVGAYDAGERMVTRLSDAGLLGNDMLFVHGAALTDAELKLLADSGAGLSVTPETELQMGMGIPVAARALAAGVQTSIGVDIVSNYAGDMFAQMRLLLQTMRSQQNLDYERAGKAPRVIRPRASEVLRLATVDAARVTGLQGAQGMLQIGDKADIVLTRTTSIHMTPATDPVGALVLNANASDVDTVLVDGRIVKRGGQLVGVDWAALSKRLRASSERILEQAATVDAAPIRNFVSDMFKNIA